MADPGEPVTITLTRDDLRALDRGIKWAIVIGVSVMFTPYLLFVIAHVAWVLSHR